MGVVVLVMALMVVVLVMLSHCPALLVVSRECVNLNRCGVIPYVP